MLPRRRLATPNGENGSLDELDPKSLVDVEKLVPEASVGWKPVANGLSILPPETTPPALRPRPLSANLTSHHPVDQQQRRISTSASSTLSSSEPLPSVRGNA
jgi:hypothetical protein